MGSPGLERPLRRPSHFAGARGMSVTVRFRDPAGVAKRVRGILVASDDALDQFFVDEFAGILVTDFWAAYDAYLGITAAAA